MNRIIELSKAQCAQLFLFLSENASERSNTVDNGGQPILDTETGDVLVVEGFLSLDALEERDPHDLQVLAEAGLINLPQEESWRVTKNDPPRYVAVPELPLKIERAWARKLGFPKGLDKLDGLYWCKHEDVRNLAP